MAVIREGVERIHDLMRNDAVYLAVGTGTTEPSQSDTQLETETHRVALTAAVRQGTITQLRGLFTNANLPNTVREMGLFINATAAANSGKLVARALETFNKGQSDLLIVFAINTTIR